MMGCYNSLATTHRVHDISPILPHVVADSTWSHYTFSQCVLMTIGYVKDSPHIETETTICKISIMMLWDHGHPYIQSTPVLSDTM